MVTDYVSDYNLRDRLPEIRVHQGSSPPGGLAGLCPGTKEKHVPMILLDIYTALYRFNTKLTIEVQSNKL